MPLVQLPYSLAIPREGSNVSSRSKFRARIVLRQVRIIGAVAVSVIRDYSVGQQSIAPSVSEARSQ